MCHSRLNSAQDYIFNQYRCGETAAHAIFSPVLGEPPGFSWGWLTNTTSKVQQTASVMHAVAHTETGVMVFV